MEEEKKLDKVKKHFKRNSKLYTGIGIGVVVTVATGGLVLKTNQGRAVIKNMIVGVNWKSPITNNLYYMRGLERRGHPGKVVKILETGTRYPSQNSAAEALKVSPTQISQHLRGVRENVKGYHLEFLGDAIQVPNSQI